MKDIIEGIAGIIVAIAIIVGQLALAALPFILIVLMLKSC